VEGSARTGGAGGQGVGAGEKAHVGKGRHESIARTGPGIGEGGVGEGGRGREKGAAVLGKSTKWCHFSQRISVPSFQNVADATGLGFSVWGLE
jgi:hypothetical protein